MSGEQLSAIGNELEIVAKGAFLQQAGAVWTTQQGFLATITRTAAGHYRVQMTGGKLFTAPAFMVDLSQGGATGAAATPPSSWWSITTTTVANDTLDIWTSVNGALADFGTLTISVFRLLS